MAYLAVKDHFKYYNHIAVGYQIDYKDGHYNGNCDDGDNGIGLLIHSMIRRCKLRQVAFFVARKYGGSPLGGAKYEHVHEAVSRVIALKCDINQQPVNLPSLDVLGLLDSTEPNAATSDQASDNA